ncbi:MAG: hypothetical protein ACRDE7_01080 [Sphingobacterium sp.]
MTQQELKQGQTFEFTNDIECVTAEVEFSKTHSGSKEFKIWFNGAIVHMSKTFKPVTKKLDQLIKDWDLK